MTEKEQMIKFMNALKEVAAMLFPEFVVTKETIKVVTIENITEGSYIRQPQYYIDGVCDGKSVTIRSIGTVIGSKGAQIEIIENGAIRFVPFYAFNWQYLMA